MTMCVCICQCSHIGHWFHFICNVAWLFLSVLHVISYFTSWWINRCALCNVLVMNAVCVGVLLSTDES